MKMGRSLVKHTMYGYPKEGLIINATEDTGLNVLFLPAGDDVWTSITGGEKEQVMTDYKVVQYLLSTNFSQITVHYVVDGVKKASIVLDAALEDKSIGLLTGLKSGADKLAKKLPWTISIEKKQK